MLLSMHPTYEQLMAKACASHEQNRSTEGITDRDIAVARLYSYAYRLHTIGTFHATRVALQEVPCGGTLSTAHRQRAAESLEDLANQAMEPVPRDFRVVISTLYRYHRKVGRVIDALHSDYQECRDPQIERILRGFAQIVTRITGSNGICLTQDTEAPEQASFIVPNLGIRIVPLVYGDHHSWNLAYLSGAAPNVPTHRHRHGVEIHLGFNPTHGLTVLGGHRAPVTEGYAMPIPPDTDHGWVNTADEVHHVPFIFGSLIHGGWGVFLDVIAQPRPVEQVTTEVPRNSTPFSQMVDLEQHIARAEAAAMSWRSTLIPYTVTHRRGSGGLELSLTRINPAGYDLSVDDFRAVGVVRGQGTVSIEGIEQTIRRHDHFGVPAGMQAHLKQTGDQPLVVLDALIKGFGKRSVR